MTDDMDIRVVDTSTLTGHGDIDVQIATAKQHPRDVTQALKEARQLATLDPETASSMFYAMPRGGKTVEGPSVRLAEILAYSWGNLRVDADVIGEEGNHIVAMGTCFDLERNVAIRVKVKRRITDSRGHRYNDDMVGVTSNAALSIALRNAVFKTIPAVLVTNIYAEARKASLGKGGTLTQNRQNALKWFGKLNVTEEDVCRVLDVSSAEEIGEDELITLRGLRTAIQDGETTVEQTFRQKKPVQMPEPLEPVEQADAEPQPANDTMPAGRQGRQDMTALREECANIIAELPGPAKGYTGTLDTCETVDDLRRYRDLLSAELDKQTSK